MICTARALCPSKKILPIGKYYLLYVRSSISRPSTVLGEFDTTADD
jgi:hypothetical protein